MSVVIPISEEQKQVMAQAVANMPLPQVVFNGFATTHSTSEITSVVSFGPRPLVMLIMPPVVAKSFAQSILESVEHYEAATGANVGTISELQARMDDYEREHPP